jgi:hypothetical protein
VMLLLGGVDDVVSDAAAAVAVQQHFACQHVTCCQ